MDALFDAYADALPRVKAWAEERFPRGEDEPEAAHRRSINAKAFDLLRGLLPAASLSHMGIFATGQAYEQLLLHLFASPLPEAREYGAMILAELQKTMPSFVARVDNPERGGRWIEYLEERGRAADRWAARLGLDSSRREEDTKPSVRLLSVQGSEDDLFAALLFEAAGVSEDEIRSAVHVLPPDERATLLGELVGERENRRPGPGHRQTLRGPRNRAPPRADPCRDPDARQARGARVAMANGALPDGRRVAPSILAADWSRMGEQVQTVMDAGARVIHVDVMDGHFVPPITMGPQMVQALSDQVHAAGGWLDVHLMIDRPEHQVEAFARAGADSINIHWEATPHVHYALKAVREAGCVPGLAINPATPPEAVDGVAHSFEILLCMTVNPGW